MTTKSMLYIHTLSSLNNTLIDIILIQWKEIVQFVMTRLRGTYLLPILLVGTGFTLNVVGNMCFEVNSPVQSVEKRMEIWI
jgi:hypothetical protein